MWLDDVKGMCEEVEERGSLDLPYSSIDASWGREFYDDDDGFFVELHEKDDGDFEIRHYKVKRHEDEYLTTTVVKRSQLPERVEYKSILPLIK